MERLKISDIIFLPKRFYEGISSRLWTLYIGIIFVGIGDLLVIYIENFKKLFVNRPFVQIIQNSAISLGLIIIMGAMDVLFFSIPLSDIFKRLDGGSDALKNDGVRIKMMKVYITANVLLLVINVTLLLIGIAHIGGPEESYSSDFFTTLLILWICAIMTRGASAIYNLELKGKIAVFISVYVWSMLLNTALSYVYNHIILKVLTQI
jgi:hypothetical protein